MSEGLRDTHAEFGLHDLLDLGEGERPDVVLQPREGFEVGRGQKVCARREQLAELDVGGAEFFEVGGQLVGDWRGTLGADLFLDERGFEASPSPCRSARTS